MATSRPGEAPRPALSVVAPCFNEEAVLPEFVRRIGLVLDGLPGPSEIVLVDDGSRDGTWAVMTAAAARRSAHRGGPPDAQPRPPAGAHRRPAICRGERILVIDADLQDPPELLPEMMALMDARRPTSSTASAAQRDGESLFKRATAAAFYRLIGRITDVEIPTDAGDFRLITRRVLDLLIAMPERHRFIRGMVAWIGGRQVPLVYDRAAARGGREQVPAGQDGALRRRRHHRLFGRAADGLDDDRLGDGGGRLRLLHLFDRRLAVRP